VVREGGGSNNKEKEEEKLAVEERFLLSRGCPQAIPGE
jgi:hypothetical protein